jgi:hypothetical protein
MEETDILLTVAEIGVALAGFASLAAILGRKHKHTDPMVNAIRLRGLLDAGLSTMLLAVIGVLILQITGPNALAWQVASVFGVLIVSTLGIAAYKRENLRRHLPGYRKRIAFVMFTMLAAAFAGFAITGLGLSGEYGFHVYFGILCLLLMICCTMFVLVIASLVMPDEQPDSENGVVNDK